jgi:hypothetical protein
MTSDPILRQRIEALDARIRSALSLVASSLMRGPLAEARAHALRTFLEGAPAMGLNDHTHPTTLEVGATASLDALTWCLHGQTDRFLPWLGGLLSLSGLDPAEVQALEAAGEQLNPAWAGAWIELHEAGASLGWLWPADMALHDALSLCHPSATRDAFADWARANGVRTGRRVGRSLAAGQPLSHVVVDIDAANLPPLLTRLRVPYPDALIDTLTEEAAACALALQLVFNDHGLLRVGVQALSPPKGLISLWLRLLRHDAAAADALAAFEGTLGDPTAIAEWRLGQGFQELYVLHILDGTTYQS